jgi:hypothetical protein
VTSVLIGRSRLDYKLGPLFVEERALSTCDLLSFSSHPVRYLKRGSTHQSLSGMARSYDRGVEGRSERKEPWT